MIVHLTKSNTSGSALSKVNSRIWSEFELASDTVSFLVHSDLIKIIWNKFFWHSLTSDSKLHIRIWPDFEHIRD